MSFHEIFNQLFDQSGTPQTLSTGIRSLDKLIDDGFGAEVVVIAGRPNHGKTTLLLNFVLNFSYFQEYKGIYIAPRADQKSLTKRLLMMMEDTDIPLDLWSEELLVDRMVALKKLFQQKVLVDYHIDNVDTILTKAKESKVSYVIIDDFFTIFENGSITPKVYGEILYKINQFVREINIPVFLGMTLWSSTDRRGATNYPLLIDIYRSDYMLPHVHKVFFVYREFEVGILEAYGGGPSKFRMECLLKINSRGQVGSLDLGFKASGRIEG